MLRMDQVHVIRHKVLREGSSVRQVARELGLSRNTVSKYLEPIGCGAPDLSPAAAAGLGASAITPGRTGGRMGTAHDRQTTADRGTALSRAGGRRPSGWPDHDLPIPAGAPAAVRGLCTAGSSRG